MSLYFVILPFIIIISLLAIIISHFTVILKVEIPQNFPTFQPTLQFASIAKESNAKTVKDYPYSPRWLPEEMTERLK